MKNGWKTVSRDGPHYFENGQSLCGFFKVSKEFEPEDEPDYEESCSKCWQVVHQLPPIWSAEEERIGDCLPALKA
jgi:hypothetical protein